eukprot:1324182-Lingulodinium_polyedra.AAC.1
MRHHRLDEVGRTILELLMLTEEVGHRDARRGRLGKPRGQVAGPLQRPLARHLGELRLEPLELGGAGQQPGMAGVPQGPLGLGGLGVEQPHLPALRWERPAPRPAQLDAARGRQLALSRVGPGAIGV